MRHYPKPDAAKNTVSTESFLSQHLDGTCVTTGTNVKSCNRWSQLTLSACDVCIKPPKIQTRHYVKAKIGASENRWISGQQGQ